VTYAEILELPPSERLQLLEAIWDSLVEVPEAIPVSQEMREELDCRLESYYRNPEAARPWDEIKDELFRTK
jgi:putative addiction module component (TIGR02574 family)